MTSHPLEVINPKTVAKLGEKFISATYRPFRPVNLETACEDYGQTVI